MERPVCYDVTRLLTRVLNATPNGIDRIDFALASHFLSRGDVPAQIEGRAFGSTSTGFGARLLDQAAAAEAVRAIGAHWGETGRTLDDDFAYQRVVAFLTRRGSLVQPATSEYRPRKTATTKTSSSKIGASDIFDWIRRHGLPLRRTPSAHLPPHSIYINASQFPLWVESSFAWLETRPDVRAAFFIHDLLPLRFPEYFPVAEFERHHKRMRTFAKFGAAAFVTTRTVAADLEAHLATLGRQDCKIFVAPPPVAPVFATPRFKDPSLSGNPFFVLCSTLEPRKNHLMILAVWRALVERMGRNAPKLILVGTRGWQYAPIIDLLARSPALRDHVLEVGGLSTPALKRLIDHAQAILMPSFGEGYGLPVHEALAAGAPVIASDIPVFREIEADGLTRLSPLDGEAWLEAITALSWTARPPFRQAPRAASTWAAYFEALERFLEAL